MTGPDESLSPPEAFGLLGEETRLSILRELGTAARSQRRDDGPVSLSFSELYDRTASDSTQSLAYHLRQLDGPFVRKTEDGYRLSPLGEKVTQAVFAGTYTAVPDFESTDLDGHCPHCEERTLTARFDAGELVVECPACDRALVSDVLLPAQTDGRTASAVLDSYDRRIRGRAQIVLGGDCPECGGRMDQSIRRALPDEPAVVSYQVFSQCDTCSEHVVLPVVFAARTHPGVVSFYWERGHDITTDPLWEFYGYLVTGEWELDVASPNPFEGTVRIRVDGDELRVGLDEDLSVTGLTRVERHRDRE